jgi:protein-S-isoprenylcysteine O-methyltransferase Ste14
MEEAFAKIEELAAHVKEYVNVRIDSVKLNAAEKTSSVMANLIAGAVVAVTFFLFFLFVNFSVAYALAEWIGKTWAGFLIVSVFYLLLAIIVWAAREKLIRMPIINSMVALLFKTDVDEPD